MSTPALGFTREDASGLTNSGAPVRGNPIVRVCAVARVLSREGERPSRLAADAPVRGKALAGWKSGLRWKRSSGLTTAATRNQPRCGGVGRLLDHA